MAVRKVFAGYMIKVRYAIPVPPGWPDPPVKEEVVLNTVPTMQIALGLLPGIYQMFADIRESFAGFSPYDGWSPFEGPHVEISPLYTDVEVP